jgi:four helix bundle protein
MRRAAVSIASNISEGAARQGEKEYIRFLYIAAGSTSELYTQLEISKLIGFGNEEARLLVTNKTVNVARMLRALIRSMKLRGRKAGIKSTNHESPITNH